MPVNDDLKRLYQQWRIVQNHFVDGGVVDEQCYLSGRKMLVLLKEPNDKDQNQGWTLPGYILNLSNTKMYDPTFTPLGLWSYGIQKNFPAFDQIENDPQAIAEGLKYLAVTNLKKSGGGGSSSLDVITETAVNQKDLWTEEITIMKPEFVICGGTYRAVAHALGLWSKTRTMNSGARYATWNGTIFVEFVHPNVRVFNAAKYAYFKETVTSLKHITTSQTP